MTRQYAEAGVDLEGAETAKARIARAVATTRTRAASGTSRSASVTECESGFCATKGRFPRYR